MACWKRWCYRFRPLSGHLISKLFLVTTKGYIVNILFPSPLGASYFQIQMYDILRLVYGYSFRPLSGHLISKFDLGGIYAGYISPFPSPLGASYFQMSKWIPYYECNILYVSVPSRGILFPNTARQSPLFCWLFWLFCVANHFLVYFSYI